MGADDGVVSVFAAYEVCFPEGYRPRKVCVCESCAALALSKVAGAAGWAKQNGANAAYACDLRYEGCEHPAGLRR